MKEQVLLFEINEDTIRKQVRRALLPLRIRVRVIEKGQYHMTLGELAANLPSADSDEANPIENPPLAAPMMVLAGLTSSRLDSVLRALREQRVNLPYKAVLTAHNAAWTPAQLLDELIQEHARIQELQKQQ
ncbi:MAG: DUF3783 domain-containing protein [Eubacterium sp.]|nr:DUF3783 domain-containing protein [Eubacterium sp.]